MRLVALALATFLGAAPMAAQQPSQPSPGQANSSASSTPDGSSGAANSNGTATPAPSQAGSGLPVSLDRIRDRLARPVQGGLRNLDLKPDFVVRIEERDHLISVLSKLQVPASAPFPAGGLYGYEQQQIAFPKNAYPLMQPYAAFSGTELITLAVEGLAQKYLKDVVGGAISNVMKERADRAARQEVAAAIAEYCETQPNGGRDLHLCSDAVAR